MTDEIKHKLKVYKELPKWKGKIFMKDEETCYIDGLIQGETENAILRKLLKEAYSQAHSEFTDETSQAIEKFFGSYEIKNLFL